MVWLSLVVVFIVGIQAHAGTFKDGCKAILIAAVKPYTNDFAFNDSLSLMKSALQKKGCKTSDIHVVYSTDYKPGTLEAAKKQFGENRVKIVQENLRLGNTYEADKEGVDRAFAAVEKDLKATDRVFVVVAGHSDGRGATISTEYTMNPQDLKARLEKLDAKIPGGVTKQVSVDICWSGQFVAPLTDPKTCVVTSQNSSDYSFYNAAGGNSFTFFLARTMAVAPNLRRAANVATKLDSEDNEAQSSSKVQPYVESAMGSEFGMLAGVDYPTLKRIDNQIRKQGCRSICEKSPHCKHFADTGICRISCEIERFQLSKHVSKLKELDERRRKILESIPSRTGANGRTPAMGMGFGMGITEAQGQKMREIYRQEDAANEDAQKFIQESRLLRILDIDGKGSPVQKAWRAAACMNEEF